MKRLQTCNTMQTRLFIGCAAPAPCAWLVQWLACKQPLPLPSASAPTGAADAMWHVVHAHTHLDPTFLLFAWLVCVSAGGLMWDQPLICHIFRRCNEVKKAPRSGLAHSVSVSGGHRLYVARFPAISQPISIIITSAEQRTDDAIPPAHAQV